MTTTDIPTSIKPAFPVFAAAIDAAVLKAAMTKLKPATGRGGYSPALTCVRFDAAATEVTVTATNLDLELSTVVPGTVGSTGSLLVPADLVNKIISVNPKGRVEIYTEPSATYPGKVDAYVRNGNARVSYEPTPIEEFPRYPVIKGRAVKLNLDVFPELLPAMSKDGSRPILCSLHVEQGVYVTTDSYRLHIVDTSDVNDTGAAFLVPREAVEVMAKCAGAGLVNCRVDERDIMVVLDETTTLRARLVEGSFPPYRNLIPVNQPHLITFTDQLVTDLKALEKLDKSGVVSITPLGCDELELAAHMGDERKATVITPGRSSLGYRVAFNPPYLQGILAGTSVNELHLTDRLKPAMLVEPAPEYGTGAQRKRLIMPVRVD